MKESKLKALTDEIDEETISDFLTKSKYVPHNIFYKRYFLVLRKLLNFMKQSNNNYWIRKYKNLIVRELVEINQYMKTKDEQIKLKDFE